MNPIARRLLRIVGGLAAREAAKRLSRSRGAPGSRPPDERAPSRRPPARSVPSRGFVPTEQGRAEVRYAPARDGDADPGEIVWTWVPFEDDPLRGKDRPVLVVGSFGRRDVAGLQLTSQPHDDRHHHPVGVWDPRDGRSSWVRLDRVLRLNPSTIRREGAVLDRDRFDAVVDAWRAY